MKKVNENKLKEYTMWNKRVLSGVQLDNQLKITFKGGESERTMTLLLKSDNLFTGLDCILPLKSWTWIYFLQIIYFFHYRCYCKLLLPHWSTALAFSLFQSSSSFFSSRNMYLNSVTKMTTLQKLIVALDSLFSIDWYIWFVTNRRYSSQSIWKRCFVWK